MLQLKLKKRLHTQKVFCVGCNKTGTTSMAKALSGLGYHVAPDKPAALLLHDWACRDFRRLIKFCRQYDAFQDSPFSYPFTYQALDTAFPTSKFVLTVRRSASEWYESLIRFHAKLFGKESPPTSDDLKNHVRYYRGRMWDGQRLVFGIDENSLYDEAIYKQHYRLHNEMVLAYFRHRPDDLLVLNVADENAFSNLCDFLGKKCPSGAIFPWENKTGAETIPDEYGV